MNTFNWQESIISMVLGFLVVIVSGILLYQYAQEKQIFQNGFLARNIASPSVTPIPSGSPTEKKDSTYTVKSGDTLWGIAEKTYGDGSAWKKIAKENGISEPKNIRSGQILNMSSSVAGASSGENILATSTSIPATHTISPGDTLWSISEKYYGTGYMWKEIALKNNISNPRLIHAKNLLQLPPQTDTLEKSLIQAKATQTPVPSATGTKR